MAKLIQNQQDLVEWIRRVRGKLDLAVAFWGEGAVAELALERKDLDIRVMLDLNAGGTNPKEVELLQRTIGEERVKCLNRLHAKAYVASEHMLIGSANASANGLGAEGHEATHWHELGLLTDDVAAINATQGWFEAKWVDAKQVSPGMLADAQRRWDQNRSRRAFVSPPDTGLLAAAIANTSDFANRKIYVEVSVEDLDEDGEAALEERRQLTGQEIFAFQHWPGIPLGATLICFTHDEKSGFEADDPMLYRTEEVYKRSMMKWITPLSPKRQWEGFQVEGIGAWRERLEIARIKLKRTWKKEEGMCMPLDEFVMLTNR